MVQTLEDYSEKNLRHGLRISPASSYSAIFGRVGQKTIHKDIDIKKIRVLDFFLAQIQLIRKPQLDLTVQTLEDYSGKNLRRMDGLRISPVSSYSAIFGRVGQKTIHKDIDVSLAHLLEPSLKVV